MGNFYADSTRLGCQNKNLEAFVNERKKVGLKRKNELGISTRLEHNFEEGGWCNKSKRMRNVNRNRHRPLESKPENAFTSFGGFDSPGFVFTIRMIAMTSVDLRPRAIMRSLKFYIALSLFFLLLPFTEAGIIKNFFTSVIKGKDTGNQDEKQSNGHVENEHESLDQNAWRTNDDYRSKPSGQYGAAGTYSKKPIVIDGTTEKYKNTSWYIENEDYLSPNKNESRQQQKPSSQYGAAGTYTLKPVGGGTTEKFLVSRTGFTNNNRPVQDNNDDLKANIRSSEKLKTEGNKTSVVLEAEGVTCCYSKLDDKIENRKLRCNEIDCRLDKVYEKSSLWVCDTMKCTVASVDFSQNQGSKTVLECSDGRNIITVQDKQLNCGPNEKEHNGRCRKIFGAIKPEVVRGCYIGV